MHTWAKKVNYLQLTGAPCRDDFFSWYKEPIPVRDWQETFKYVINVEGNCASARLASQLLGDSAVFWVAGEDQEW